MQDTRAGRKRGRVRKQGIQAGTAEWLFEFNRFRRDFFRQDVQDKLKKN